MSEVLAPGEVKHSWDDLSIPKQMLIVILYRKAYINAIVPTVKPLDEWKRGFDLGKPFIIEGDAYYRVAKESIDVMKVITKTYLI